MLLKKYIREPRFRAALLLPIIIFGGLALKFYRGPGDEWVNHWGPASVAYVWAFMLMGFMLFPDSRAIIAIALVVLIGTCCVEWSQQFEVGFLKTARQTWFGRMLFGTTYSAWDFPAYFVGSLTGIGLLHWCVASQRPIDSTSKKD
ncbi:MAG: DUF2809 domain-containing protein [Pirellulaceae bacterium]|nr:DUF2809 domain-containing protein [Pirellulaceae bacterium]